MLVALHRKERQLDQRPTVRETVHQAIRATGIARRGRLSRNSAARTLKTRCRAGLRVRKTWCTETRPARAAPQLNGWTCVESDGTVRFARAESQPALVVSRHSPRAEALIWVTSGSHG
jgi:hypothetical protein